MKTRQSVSLILTSFILFTVFVVTAGATTDDFERSGPALGANWAAHSEMVIQNGNLHNQSSTTGWNTFLAVYYVTGANEAIVHWPQNGDGVDETGSELGGIAILNDFSAASDGYFVYIYASEVRLYRVQGGSPTTLIQDKQVSTSVSPGDDFKVSWNASTYTFNVYVNDSFVSTLTDGGQQVDITNAYAGVMLYGGDNFNNDVEAFTAQYVEPAVDDTAPAQITDLSATAASSSSISLSWTAPGDDGNTGTASDYEIRYATQDITTDNDFQNATPLVGVPSPKQAGQSESFMANNLQSSTTYYFAIKTSDEANNVSLLSNSASATTTDGGGGGGGGTTEGSCVTDHFDRAELGSFWDPSANHIIENGELTLASASGGWSNIAIYQRGGAMGVGMRFSSENADFYNNDAIPAGLLILADNPSPDMAIGYLLYRKTDELSVYRIQPGSNPQYVDGHNVSQPRPGPGDLVKAEILDNGSTKTITYLVNGLQDAQFSISNSTPLADLYGGIVQYGGSNILNNIDSFTACYAGGVGPINLEMIAGNNQSGPIETQLPEPLQVRVTNENGEPYEGALLDFQVTNGEARLDDIEDFNFNGRIWSEVEDGRLQVPIATVEDDGDASGGKYVTTSWTSGFRYKRAVEVPFYVPERANYDIYLRYKSPDGSGDTGGVKNNAYVSIDKQDSVFIEVPAPMENWRWYKAENYTISRGIHTFNIIIYEPGWDWDKILVQKSSLEAPSLYSIGSTGPDFPNVTDAEGMAQTHVTFQANADDNVVVEVTGRKNDGTHMNGSPARFTLDPLAGPAFSMERDPSVPEDPIIATPGQDSPALKVIIKDSYGNRKSGTTVNWSITQGDGTLAQTQTVSDQLGVATNTLELGYQKDNYVVQAQVEGLEGSPVNFTIEPTEPPHSMVVVSPKTTQQANANTTLDSLLTVRVLKEDGSPFEGFPVEFVVTQGEGSLSSEGGQESQSSITILSDVSGYARARWTLGQPGSNIVEARGGQIIGSPAIFQANAITGAPSNLVIVSGDNQEGYVGMPLAEPFIVKVTDSNGFPIAEQQVRFDILSPTAVAYFDQAGRKYKTMYTDQNGKASATLTMGDQLNEEHLVKVSVVNRDIDDVFFHATPVGRIAKTLRYHSGNGSDGRYQQAIVKQDLQEPFTVKALDPFGNAVADQPVTFNVIEGGGDFNGSSQVTVKTDGSGLASALLTVGDVSGDSNNVANAVAYRVDLPSDPLDGSPVIFKATAKSAPAHAMVKIDSTDNQQADVGQALNYPIQIQIVDQFQNPIKEHPVTFAVQGDGGELEDASGKSASKVVMTGTDGIASVVWHMPELPGIYSVDVSSRDNQGNMLSGSPMSFSAKANVGKAHRMNRITADTVIIDVVGKTLEEKIKVQIVDQYNNPVIGYPVTFKIKEGGGLLNGINQVTVPTADLGYAEAEWQLGTKAGVRNNVVEVTAAVEANPKIIYTASARPDVAYRLEPDSSFTHVGSVGSFLPDPIRVNIRDKYGNGVTGRKVDFTLESVDGNIGYLNSKGTISVTETSDDKGLVQVRWALGPEVGSLNNHLRVESEINGEQLVNSPYYFKASAQVGVAHELVKMTDDTTKELSSIVGNTLSEYLKVLIVDDFNNPIARHPVRFEVLSREEADGGSLDGKVDSVKVKETNSNGMAYVHFTLGQKAGRKINRVQVSAEKVTGGQHLKGSPLVYEITGLSTNATDMEIADGNNQQGTVGQFLPRPIKVLAKDRNGNPVEKQPIHFQIIPQHGELPDVLGALGPGTVIDTTVDTRDDGIATIQWRLGHAVGTYELRATSHGLDGSPLTFNATAMAAVTDPDTSQISVAPARVTVSEGGQKSEVTVTLRDRFGNPVANKAVTVRASGDGNNITQPTSTTNENGRAVGFISSKVAGKKYITARDQNSGVDLSDSVMVTFVPSEAYGIAKTQLNSGDGQKRNVGTVLPKTLRVLVTDKFNNPIYGVPVNYTVTQGGGKMIENQPVITDSTGIAQSHFRLGEKTGANIVEVRANGLVGSPLHFNEFGQVPERLVGLEKISGDNLKAGPGQELPEELGVRVLDANGWPVFGENVKFEVLHNNGSIVSSNPIKSDMYGEAHAKALVGTNSGLNIYRAQLTNYPHITATFYDTTGIVPGAGATTIEYVSGDNQSGTVGQTLFSPLVVRTVDDFGNPIPDVPVTFTVVDDQTVAGVGMLEGGVKTITKNSNSDGKVAVYYTLGMNVGVNKIRASSQNLQPVNVEFTVTAVGDTPYSMEKHSGDGQIGEMGKVLLYPVKVMIKDRHGNPTRGGRVSFYVLEGGGSVIEPQPVTSDMKGIARVHWKLGPRPGAVDNTLKAVADLQGGSFIETFTAEGDPTHWPELHLPDELEVTEGSSVRFDVSATDGDGDQVFIEATSIPDSSECINNGDGTHTFRWVPDNSVVQSPDVQKTFHPTFEAVDVRGGKDIDSVKVVVKDFNHRPLITNYWPTGNIVKPEINTVQTVEFGVEASDPDGDVLTTTWYIDNEFASYGQVFNANLNELARGQVFSVKARVCDQNLCAEQYWSLFTTSVELTSFQANAEAYKGVELSWETASESGNAGFNVLRSLSKDGEYKKINTELIEPKHDGNYVYLDNQVVAGKTIYYKIEDVSVGGVKTLHGPVKAETPLPDEFKMAQNFPNPFNPITTIRYQLPKDARVQIHIYNILGQRVRTLVDRKIKAGYHAIMWDARNDVGSQVASGVYYYRIAAGDFRDVKKMAVLK